MVTERKAKVAHTGDFVLLSIERNGDKEELPMILHIIETSMGQPLYYRSDLGIGNASEVSPYGVVIGMEEGFKTDTIIRGGKVNITISSILNESIIEDFVKNLPPKIELEDERIEARKKILTLFKQN